MEYVATTCPYDARAVTLVSHILLGERAWFDRMDQREPNRAIWRPLPVEVQREMQRVHEWRYEGLLAVDPDTPIEYQRFTGERYISSIADILRHLVTHGAHHRGQLAAHVSSRGVAPINTDFLRYCMEHGL